MKNIDWENVKQKYIVTITRTDFDYGEFTVRKKNVETWAVSAEKAENNVRYRTEGRSYWCEVYGSDDQYTTFDYEARLAN